MDIELWLTLLANLIALYALYQTHFWQRSHLKLDAKSVQTAGGAIVGIKVRAGRVAAERVMVQCLARGHQLPLRFNGGERISVEYEVIPSQAEAMLWIGETFLREQAARRGASFVSLVASGRNCHRKTTLSVVPGKPVAHKIGPLRFNLKTRDMTTS